MKHDFWLERWQQNRINFHLNSVNPVLQQYGKSLFDKPKARVFVPLCGKSLDLVYLASLGHEVVGVELAELAVQSFFAENHLPLNVQQEGAFQVFRAPQITLYQGDFFATTKAQLGDFDFIYDRAALIALPSDMRRKYAAHLWSFLRPGGRLILVTVDYDQKVLEGPPFAVSTTEVASLFAGYDCHILETEETLESNPRFAEAGLKSITQTVWSIVKE